MVLEQFGGDGNLEETAALRGHRDDEPGPDFLGVNRIFAA
jgi:hypothetical protein